TSADVKKSRRLPSTHLTQLPSFILAKSLNPQPNGRKAWVPRWSRGPGFHCIGWWEAALVLAVTGVLPLAAHLGTVAAVFAVALHASVITVLAVGIAVVLVAGLLYASRDVLQLVLRAILSLEGGGDVVTCSDLLGVIHDHDVVTARLQLQFAAGRDAQTIRVLLHDTIDNLVELVFRVQAAGCGDDVDLLVGVVDQLAEDRSHLLIGALSADVSLFEGQALSGILGSLRFRSRLLARLLLRWGACSQTEGGNAHQRDCGSAQGL